MRITQWIKPPLKQNEVFVFGSNYAGKHSKGAALDAKRFYGAIAGQGEGLMGQSYGIPTKPHDVRNRLTVREISDHVDEFIAHAKSCQDLRFYVTEIGCGLAGYQPMDIAPLFRGAMNLENVWLPESFWKVLNK